MNYIYDIYLNLNETLYDFFDWNKNDKIIHIKKIPVIKVNEETFKTLTSNQIKVDDELLLQIYSKTEIWNMNGKINYCSLFSDNNNIIAIEFNKSGKSIKKSFMYIDEELEVLEIINKLNEKIISFEVLNNQKNVFKTRNQIKEDDFINQELKNMDESRLNYIYFECFGKREKNKKIILDNIKKLQKNSKIYENLYDILKLTSTTKK